VLIFGLRLFILSGKAHFYCKDFIAKIFFSERVVPCNEKKSGALTLLYMVFHEHEVDIPITGKRLGGTLSIGESAGGMVLFAQWQRKQQV
jgi:putative phosphoribosyl transferase